MIWSDSTLAAKPNKLSGVKKSPKPTRVPGYLETVKLHKIRASQTYLGGKLVNMLQWVEASIPPKLIANCVFVGVWSFTDLYATPSAKKSAVVMYVSPAR